MAERGERVRAKVVKGAKARTTRSLLRENIATDKSIVITDEFVSGRKLSRIVNHRVVNHLIWYVDGENHTNTVESFWALLKRGIVGQFQKVSLRYLPKYIDEFCYRFNHRKDLDIFDVTLSHSVGRL